MILWFHFLLAIFPSTSVGSCKPIHTNSYRRGFYDVHAQPTNTKVLDKFLDIKSRSFSYTEHCHVENTSFLPQHYVSSDSHFCIWFPHHQHLSATFLTASCLWQLFFIKLWLQLSFAAIIRKTKEKKLSFFFFFFFFAKAVRVCSSPWQGRQGKEKNLQSQQDTGVLISPPNISASLLWP